MSVTSRNEKYRVGRETTTKDMEREEPQQFRRLLLEGYQAIKEPGKYRLTVQNNVDRRHLIKDQNDIYRYIVNFKAVAPDQMERLVEMFGERESIPLKETNGLFLTGTILRDRVAEHDLPMKGERIEVTIDSVPSREGRMVLRITEMRPNQVKEAGYISVGDLFRVKERQLEGMEDILHTYK